MPCSRVTCGSVIPTRGLLPNYRDLSPRIPRWLKRRFTGGRTLFKIFRKRKWLFDITLRHQQLSIQDSAARCTTDGVVRHGDEVNIIGLWLRDRSDRRLQSIFLIW